MTPKEPRDTSPDANRVTLAIFALLAAERNERASGSEPRTVEAVLAASGFTPVEVQGLTGGNYRTIQSRMRPKKQR